MYKIKKYRLIYLYLFSFGQESKTEEEKFDSTLNSGEQILRKMIENVESLSGEDAFKLYDTYGFPIELTIEIAKESNKDISYKSTCDLFFLSA